MDDVDARIERCRREQLEAAAYIAAHGWDRGAVLGLSDWLMEEILISESAGQGAATTGSLPHEPQPQDQITGALAQGSFRPQSITRR